MTTFIAFLSFSAFSTSDPFSLKALIDGFAEGCFRALVGIGTFFA
jgi:hypothetical protein